jgi:hypothetical protein
MKAETYLTNVCMVKLPSHRQSFMQVMWSLKIWERLTLLNLFFSASFKGHSFLLLQCPLCHWDSILWIADIRFTKKLQFGHPAYQTSIEKLVPLEIPPCDKFRVFFCKSFPQWCWRIDRKLQVFLGPSRWVLTWASSIFTCKPGVLCRLRNQLHHPCNFFWEYLPLDWLQVPRGCISWISQN